MGICIKVSSGTLRPDLILSLEGCDLCQDLFVCFILRCWMEIELWLDSRQYLTNKLENFCHCQAPTFLTLEKDKFLNSYFVLVSIYNLVHLPTSPPLAPVLLSEYNLYKLSNSWYRGVHFRDSLAGRAGGCEGGSVFPANDIQDVCLIYYQSLGPPQS